MFQALVFALALFLLIYAIHCCPTEYTISKISLPSYTFHVNSIDPSCTTFTFVSCTSNSSQALISTNYDTCTSQICDPNTKYQQNVQAMTQCQEYNNQQDSSKLVMGIGITFGALCALFMLVVWIAYGFSRPIFKKDRITTNQDQSKDRQNKLKERLATTLSSMWRNQGSQNENFRQRCSVCLEHSPNMQLLCGHVYHLKCIIEVISRKMSCPMCRSSQFDKAKIYCHSCMASAIELSISDHFQNLGGQVLMCQNCKKAKEVTSATHLIR